MEPESALVPLDLDYEVIVDMDVGEPCDCRYCCQRAAVPKEFKRGSFVRVGFDEAVEEMILTVHNGGGD